MVEESSANVALEEGAEPTPGESLTPPEGSSAEKDGEQATGENPPAKEASSKEPPSPSESEAEIPDPPKGKDVPYGQWKDIKGRLDKVRTRLSDFEALGLKTKEDAEFLLKDAETAKEEAHKTGRVELEGWIEKNPEQFLEEFAKTYPQAADRLDRANAPNILERVAISFKQSDPDFAEKLGQLAAEFRGNGKKSGDSRPETAENDAIKREKLSIQEERQQSFDEQTEAEITSAFRSKVNELIKGLAFASDKQRERFHESIITNASNSLGKNPIFARQFERLRNIQGVPKTELQQRKKDLVALHLKHAADPDNLRKLIDEEKSLMGLQALPKANGAKTEARGEVNGSGAPPSGKMSQSEEDRIIGELKGKFTGNRLSREIAHALSRGRAGA